MTHDPLCYRSNPPSREEYPICDVIQQAEQRGRDAAMDMDPVRRREAYLHGQRDMLARCIAAVLTQQDVAKSGEGVIVIVTLGAGKGHVYVNRAAVLAALRSLGGSQPLCAVCGNPLSDRRSGDSWRCDHCQMWRGIKGGSDE